jgi:Ca-activated chloride channel homolog
MKEEVDMKAEFKRITSIVKAGCLFALIFIFSGDLFAQNLVQEDKKIIKQTNDLLQEAKEELDKNNFPAAEAAYRKAIAINPSSTTAKYNMANMYYEKEKASQATSRYKQSAKLELTKEEKHKVFHNMGNSFMEQKKYKEAIEAYKNALRNNPLDEETRYNLALAKKMLEEEQKNNEGGGDDNKDKDKKENDKNKDKKGDKGDKEKDKNEGENKDDQGEDKKDQPKEKPEKPKDDGESKDNKKQDGKNEDEQKQPQKPQQQQGQLSPQQIKNLLEAMNNEEKKVQDKINAEKAKGAKTQTEKDW